MSVVKQVYGEPLVIGGRKLSLSRVVRGGDFLFLTGQIPMVGGVPMTTGTVEDQTRITIELIREALAMAGAGLADVVKSTVYLRDAADFPGFNSVYSEYFPDEPPARSALVVAFLVDIRVEIEVIAYRPM